MLLLGALSAFGPLSMDLYLPALPSLETEFGSGQGAAQLTLTSVAVGLAAGQLVAGPLSDRFGRRVPVLVGVAAYTLASVLCALSPSVWVLVGVRLLQGLAGAAGIVLARAIIRDTTEGVAAARAFALLASIGGAAPVLAPVLGGQLLRVTDWRGVFGALAIIGLVLLVAAAWRLPETLAPHHRVRGGARASVRNARELLGRPTFRNAVLAQGLGFGVLFTYISTSSFVLQGGYGLTPVQFSLVFAANGTGIVLVGQLSRAVVARTGPRALLRAGLVLQLLTGAGLLVAAVAGAGLPVVLPLLALAVSATGLVLPNATAVAMSGAARTAGTAAALVGAAQFAVAGVGAPLAGLGAAGTLLPMAVVMAGYATLGTVAALRLPADNAALLPSQR
ncbi:multidrug effflux MFS transporter [Klenkia sp. LSe6-5]|uniref:Multidrug effflux MFS transporter n=1 Tax=Klenkia sesuvii TaxID=3103137 RepID=A0ABU8DT32_9ACTN